MLSEKIKSIDNKKFIESIEKLLIKEKIIEDKKIKGQKLTSEERFFDNYVLKPSVLIESLERKII